MYKKKIRDAVRAIRGRDNAKYAVCKDSVKELVGFWNQYCEAYFPKAIINTYQNDLSQKTDSYRAYRRSYEADYRDSHRPEVRFNVIKCVYKSKFGGDYKTHLKEYAKKKNVEHLL